MKIKSSVIILLFLLVACGGADSGEVPLQDTGATDSPQSTDVGIQSQSFVLEITNIRGTVDVRTTSNGVYTPAQVGQKLEEGAQIRTGDDGIVAMYLDTLTMVIVDNNTETEIKTLGGTVEVPEIVLLVLSGAVVLEYHAEKLPDGAVLKVETPEGNTGSILGSTVRVQYNPETKLMTTTCLTGTCEFVHGDQTLTLEAGQAVDVEGLQPPPNAPSEMSVEQANQFLEIGYQLCGGCSITIGEIRNGGLEQTSPPPTDLSNGESSTNESGSEPTEDALTEEVPNEAPSDEGSDSSDGG